MIASWNWLSYYQAISAAVHKTDATRAMATNLDCASGAWPDFKSPATGRCSPVCVQFGHTSKECSWCRSPRCANLTQEFFDIADVHIMAETTRKMVSDPSAYQMHLSFEKTVANRNKMSMFTYGAHDDEWKTLIDLAAKQGWVHRAIYPTTPTSTERTQHPATLSLPIWPTSTHRARHNSQLLCLLICDILRMSGPPPVPYAYVCTHGTRYTKFWVTDGGNNPDDMAGLPHFFEDMVKYIAAMNNGTDWMHPDLRS